VPQLPKPRRTFCGYPPRLFGYAVAVIALAVPITAGAIAAVTSSTPSTSTLAGVAIFFALTFLAEAKPVPLDEEGGRLVSLAFIFVVSSQILFGWGYGVLISSIALLAAQAIERTPALRTLFNGAAYAVAAFAASLPSLTLLRGLEPLEGERYGLLTLLSFLEGAIFVGLNVVFVCLAIALHERISPRRVVADHLRHSGPAFAIMAFIAALAVALWTVSPPLLVLLAGPLFALALFQRYALRSRVALRAASTDSLTGLKNHRSYETDIVGAVTAAGTERARLSLCLLDIDNFKQINDTLGHPTGDRMLVAFGALLADLGGDVRAYRLGGDEFALLVNGNDEAAVLAVETLRSRLATAKFADGAELTISAGIASYPSSADTPEELVRVADVALYWTKRHGKNRWCVYSPAVVELSWPAELAATAEYDARLRAAENLIHVVDARDTYTGSHSQSVAVLATAIGEAFGLGEDVVNQLRLAGLLHDLGKIAIPDEILQKDGPLDPAEYATLRTHAEIGFELLEGLDVSPVDLWIRHHHEHWDGSGYPLGLSGEEIPIGSRIVLVADAFEAMTTDRCYRDAMSVEAALAEMRRCSGSQFDPDVVAALERSLAVDLLSVRSEAA
jgi:diguanylate cyclase (GGDEF)-like protein